MLKITWELLTDLIFVFQRKIDERCTALNCNVVDSTLGHCNVFYIFILNCLHFSVCTQQYNAAVYLIYINKKKELEPEYNEETLTLFFPLFVC